MNAVRQRAMEGRGEIPHQSTGQIVQLDNRRTAEIPQLDKTVRQRAALNQYVRASDMLGLTTAAPVLGSPALGIVSREALRQRRLRKRRARGVAIYPVPVTGEMIDALVHRGYLLERDATNPAKVVKALSAALVEALCE